MMNMGMNMMGMGMNMAQQGMNMAQGMNMMPQGPGIMQGVMPTDAMTLQQRFMQVDKDHSGSVSVKEIYQLYKQMNFTEQAARLMLQAVSDQPVITMQTFPMFDLYISSAWAAFSQVSAGAQQIMNQQVFQALQMLRFRFDQQVATALISKFDIDKRGISFGEFLSICAYFLICEKLMAKFDQQKRGTITIDYNGLSSLGMWFM